MSQQIMVCDAEAHIQRAISLKLTRVGFDVKKVTEVETCWRLLQRGNPPAMLIVGRSFPSQSDGADLVNRIRMDANLADLPVLMLFDSRADMVSQQASLAELKLADTISKPFSLREIVDAVHRIVGDVSETRHAHLASDCKL
jgi:DNA-binding response OmpR family regulator